MKIKKKMKKKRKPIKLKMVCLRSIKLINLKQDQQQDKKRNDTNY